MEEKDITTPEEEATSPQQEPQPVKPMWQQTKESWYDKLDLSVKQLDWIIGLGIAGLVITFLVIALDAMGVF